MPIQTQGANHLYHTPAIFTHFPNLIAAESTRLGGISPAPFNSLNLGINTTDTPENVAENRRLFFDAIGAGTYSFASAHQVHGTEVLYTTEAGRFDGYDALITNQPGLLIGVTVADCVPILDLRPGSSGRGCYPCGLAGNGGRDRDENAGYDAAAVWYVGGVVLCLRWDLYRRMLV